MQFIKKILFVFFTVTTTYLSFGQSLIKGKIVDSENMTSLSFTQITNTENNTIITSNFDGTFEVHTELLNLKKINIILSN